MDELAPDPPAEFDLSPLDRAQRDQLREALERFEIPHEGDHVRLLVSADDAAEVDQLLRWIVESGSTPIFGRESGVGAGEAEGPGPPSPRDRRFLANLVDGIAILIIVAVLGGVASLFGVAVAAAYVIVPTWLTGRTPGKRLMELRVVDDRTGRPPGLGASTVRWFVLDGFTTLASLRASGDLTNWLVLVWAVAVPLPILWDPLAKGLHDRLVATRVIDDRPALPSPPTTDL